ncbi:hypothetical protein LDO26_14450 [Luteimonas sp. BDR2-5]|uniref:hypothetical protein n=1 Tax=Proluteimonas luteida TaxID=2878685 RepID=UPI001E48E172|nr:hypothetical protein [Luteimonas sp. BDR2-5]MCD9029393.1 hypothetical protein [Luteimonas sp. BDR2-5]
MSLTISMSGMDTATETALRAAFAAANSRIGDRYELAPETQSGHVIVDMDSMYGPMSWLRLHAAGKSVVGLTSAPRVQTHYRLGRPFDEQSMLALLREIAEAQGIPLDAEVAAPAPAIPPAEVPLIEPDLPAVDASIPGPAADATGAVDIAEAAAPPPAPPAPADVEDLSGADDAAKTEGTIVVTPAPAPAPVPAATASLTDTAALLKTVHTASDASANEDAADTGPAPASERRFADWLAPGALRGRLRYRHDAGPTLWIDADAREYVGPSTLKPVGRYFDGVVGHEAFEPVDDATWAKETADAGVQPLSRLQWLGGLLAGDGSLAEGFDPDGRFVLGKWPQTEREYPRHFRIATAMMKGPATLAEIAAACGLPAEEVVRFVNANLATGYAQQVADTPAEPEEPQKATGFFSRLRRR